MIWIVVLILLLLIVMITVLLIPYLTYKRVFYQRPEDQIDKYVIPNQEQYQKDREKMIGLIRALDEIPYESVYIKAEDGVDLFGRYYHKTENTLLHIQMHGYKGHGLRDFCGGNKIARESGQNTLIVDQRAHGKSGGNVISFGVKEHRDCLSWINYAIERFGEDTPIILSGVSMGAATVLLAAGTALPSNVIGVIADCPYSSGEGIIRKVCDDMKLPKRGVFPFIKMGAKLFGKFDITKANAVEAVSKARVPILLIHGEADRFVPVQMSQELYQANPEWVQLATFPEAGHGISYIVDTDRYTDLSKAFIAECLERKESK